MQQRTSNQPNRFKFTVLRQVCQLIPPHLVPKTARETGVDEKSRTYSAWSHVVTMLYAQISHALSLNDVCDALRLRVGSLFTIRAARPPAKNTLSHANKVRDCAMAEKLFWAMLKHLQSACPSFVRGGGKRGVTWRLRRAIHAVDSTTIQLVASCMSWAKHRRRKAAAKCHLRLNLQSFLPGFAIVDTARQHDNTRARELCAGLLEGEIVLFDKAYVDFCHLWTLMARGVFFVTRAKDNMACRVKQRLPKSSNKRILKDELIVLKGHYARQDYPGILRRITAWVEVDGEDRVMVFPRVELVRRSGHCAESKMGQEQLDFSAEAVWASIPVHGREGILAAVWCGNRRTGVKMVDYTAHRIDEALILQGHCSVCGGPVRRHIEAPDGRPYWVRPKVNRSRRSP